MEDDALRAVNDLFDSSHEIYEWLMKQEQVSFATEHKGQFAKIVLLACASYFETRVTGVVLDVLDTKKCTLTHNFVSKKALSRQYHTLFDWKGKNANNFFGLFGKDFKEFAKVKIKNSDILSDSIKNFLELGDLRNQLVHNNYAMFSLNLTVKDISEKFASAQSFVSNIKPLVNEYRDSLKPESNRVTEGV